MFARVAFAESSTLNVLLFILVKSFAFCTGLFVPHQIPFCTFTFHCMCEFLVDTNFGWWLFVLFMFSY